MGRQPGDMVRLSHQRSAAFGLRASEQPDASPLSPTALNELLERNRLLDSYALPAMENLYAQIAGTRSMVLLTDGVGTILHSIGDADFLARAQQVALHPGVAWSEERKGTNAIGTALVEGTPTQIHAQQHFLQANHFLTCSCAPIFDPLGILIGALDVSGDHRSQGKHTLALVRMSAQMVENHLFTCHFEHAVQVHFHARPEFLGTLLEGVAAFDAQGRFLSANRSAQFQLGMQLGGLRAHTFSSLFGAEVSSLLAHCDAASPALLTLHVPGGVKVVARAQMHRPAQHPFARGGAPAPAVVDPPSAAPAKAQPGLQALNTGDPHMARVVDQLTRMACHDIPVLVLGETGTGKELLARALHHDSPRRGKPLVAVNCASIPESLIESELFGYGEGAFTGARRKGCIGKIAQAHGGTLFLDEIGDMPLPLQARLLRVLQEREVVPLGGSHPLKVDVAVVCATHRDLRAMRAAGTFRDDLYWRINGFVVRLPALRERSDIADIAQRLLRTQAKAGTARGAAPPLALDPAVLALFARHPWPGNIRQLASLLQSAALLAEGEDGIRVEHLPEDFLEDCEPAPAATGGRPGTAEESAVPQVGAHRLQQVADSAIQAALQVHGGNVSAAARALGVARNTVYRRMQRH